MAINIVSFSGGKDSTALLLMMLEKGMKIDDIIYCDTGAEFPQMYQHIEKVEKYIGRPITRLHDDHDFWYYLLEKKILRGKRKGQIGYTWPFRYRWCTGMLKIKTCDRYLKKYEGQQVNRYIGIAADEAHRCKEYNYPLVEWGITEKQALEYCYSKGFNWGGLYEHFRRVSCWCCPLQRMAEIRALRQYYPDLWYKLGAICEKTAGTWRPKQSWQSLEDRFKKEEEKEAVKTKGTKE